jgi:predicted dehydrogenase
MKEVRLGIIGAGGIVAYGHLPALAEMKQVRVETLCDLQKERAEALAEKYGIGKVCTRPAALLKNDELDAVLIAVPNAYHAPLALQALDAGKHVICEKPPAMNASQTARMVAQARRRKRALLFAFNQRYTDRSQELKRRIQKDHLGDIYYLRAGWTRRRFIPGLGGWFTDRKLSGGGPLIDIGVHVLDLALWFCDYPKVKSVTGATFHELGKKVARTDLGPQGSEKMTVEDLASAFIRFQNGGVLFMEASFTLHTKAKERVYLDLMGTQGGAEWRFPLSPDEPPLTLTGEEKGRPYDLIPHINEGQPWQSYARELEEFLRCVEEPARSWPQAAQGIELMKIIDAIYASAKSGREIVLR